MGDNEVSAPKFPRTKSPDQSLDMHHSHIEPEPHVGACVGADRFPPAVCVVAVARASGSGTSDGHFSHTLGMSMPPEGNSNKTTALLSPRMPKISVCRISEVLLKLRPRSAKYKGHLKQTMAWWWRIKALTKGEPDTDRGFASRGVGDTSWFCSFPQMQSLRDS